MRTRSLVAVLVASMAAVSPLRAADEYVLDTSHAAATFKVSHAGLSWTYGRFKDLSGGCTLDGDKSSFALSIKTESVDTDNAKRDEHLRGPDFFNVKQFPAMTFKSTSVKAIKDGYEVTGDLSLHGATKPVTFKLLGGKTAELPKGVQRTGFSTELSIKRSDFGMDKGLEAVGDEVFIAISFEALKK